MLFDLDIMAYILEQRCEEISHFVMPPLDKPHFHTRHCMIDVKSLVTFIQTGGTSVSNGTLNLVNHRIPCCLDCSLRRYFLPSVVILMLVPSNTSRAHTSVCDLTTNHDFAAFGLYPSLGP